MIGQDKNYLTTGSMTEKNPPINNVPKIVSLKIINPKVIKTLPWSNKITPTNLTPTQLQQNSPSIESTIPMIDSFTSVMENEFSDEQENDCVNNDNQHFIWNHKSTMLFFSEYEEHEKKFQKRKYQSKEAMFEAIAKAFQAKGYTSTTKNHIKNKFKLLKKNWDKHVKRTYGKNSSGKGTKPLLYEKELINIFGKSHSGVPLIVAGRYGTTSQKEILENVSENFSENEYEEQEEQISANSNVPTLSTNNNSTYQTSTMMDSKSSFTNARVKPRDGKLAQTLQSVKDSICSILQKESDNKQEIRRKVLIELQINNELQNKRNIILEKQLLLLEDLAKQLSPTET